MASFYTKYIDKLGVLITRLVFDYKILRRKPIHFNQLYYGYVRFIDPVVPSRSKLTIHGRGSWQT